jgi:hypothetical protein
MGVGGKGSSSSSSSSSSSASSGGLSGALGAAAGMLGGGKGGPTGGGLAAAGPFAGIIQGQAKTFIETLKKSVREVRITVTWKDGKLERSISASQQIVILPESVGKAGTDLSNVVPSTGGPTQGQQNAAGVNRPPGLGTVKLPTNSGDGSSQ